MVLVTDRLPRPPYEPELARIIPDATSVEESFDIQKIRAAALNRIKAETEKLLTDPTLEIQQRTIPGPRTSLTVAVVRRRHGSPQSRRHRQSRRWSSLVSGRSKSLVTGSGLTELRPGILYIHGGALIRCNRFAGLDTSAVWAREMGAVTVSVEYGLAPENQGSAPAEDCYAALRWMQSNAIDLGIDPQRLMVYGVSAGGCLAASTALMVRDETRRRSQVKMMEGPSYPEPCALFLECPMLDDRTQTISAQQFATPGSTYNSTLNRFAWNCLLGDRAGSADVSPYEAPARAIDLTGLPPVYLDCASADPFRDEIVAFASGLWAAGASAELHVFPGGPHGYDRIAPDAPISVTARSTRLAWIKKMLVTRPAGD